MYDDWDDFENEFMPSFSDDWDDFIESELLGVAGYSEIESMREDAELYNLDVEDYDSIDDIREAIRQAKIDDEELEEPKEPHNNEQEESLNLKWLTGSDLSQDFEELTNGDNGSNLDESKIFTDNEKDNNSRKSSKKIVKYFIVCLTICLICTMILAIFPELSLRVSIAGSGIVKAQAMDHFEKSSMSYFQDKLKGYGLKDCIIDISYGEVEEAKKQYNKYIITLPAYITIKSDDMDKLWEKSGIDISKTIFAGYPMENIFQAIYEENIEHTYEKAKVIVNIKCYIAPDKSGDLQYLSSPYEIYSHNYTFKFSGDGVKAYNLNEDTTEHRYYIEDYSYNISDTNSKEPTTKNRNLNHNNYFQPFEDDSWERGDFQDEDWYDEYYDSDNMEDEDWGL